MSGSEHTDVLRTDHGGSAMYTDVNEALHRLFEVVEAATDSESPVGDLAEKVARVDALDRRLRRAATARTERIIDDTTVAVVLLGKKAVEAEARALLKAWAPTGLLEAEESPFDLRRPLSPFEAPSVSASGPSRTAAG